MAKQRPKGLGRGLDVLLGVQDMPAEPVTAGPVPGDIQRLSIADLQAGRYQPRTRMDESALQELAASIQQHGLMQPIVVRPLHQEGGPSHEIIAGERRFRAAKLAGLDHVPVIVRDVPDEQALALALIENIQREDLNPLEQARAIKQLIEEFSYSHEQAADAIGRSRSATSNLLRLLNLAEPVQTMLLAGDLDMGHARALLPVDRATQIMLANLIVQKRLSVRETEKLVTATLAADAAGLPADPAARPAGRQDVQRLQEMLSETLGTTVTLKLSSNGRGRLVIDIAGPEQFEGLLQRMRIAPEH